MTKSFIYKIPITAVIMSPPEYEKLEEENMKKGISLLHPFTKIYIEKKKKSIIDINVNLPELNQNLSEINDTRRNDDSFTSTKRNDPLPKIK